MAVEPSGIIVILGVLFPRDTHVDLRSTEQRNKSFQQLLGDYKGGWVSEYVGAWVRGWGRGWGVGDGWNALVLLTDPPDHFVLYMCVFDRQQSDDPRQATSKK